jgi:mRNA interferase YafQ
MEKLILGTSLDARHRDHPLLGSYAGRRECHLEPDWLLIYKLSGADIIFERTGTHTDLFR